MSNFHQDYVDSISHFCASLPAGLGIDAQDVDIYFRACTLSVWARSPKSGGDVIGINQIYTKKRFTFTPEQYQNAISYYKGDMRAEVPMPDFFVKLVAWDKREGSSFSRTFAEITKNLLMLCATYDGDLSLPEIREVTRQYDRLAALCSEGGVKAIPVTPDPAAYLGRREEKVLTDLLDDVEQQLETGRNMYGDFWGGKGAATTDSAPAEPAAPQGQENAAEEKEAAEEAPKAEEEPISLEDAMAELHALVGLEVVKEAVDGLVNLAKVRKLRKERGMKCPDMSFHLVFSGNPGTGKTTVARIVGKIYHALGILSKGQLVEVDRSGLVAGYVGQTAIKTQEVIKSALGGVLFIDEAYTLAPESADKDFGQEAIDTILKAMEDHRDDFVVIVAGYDDLMPRFIDSNPGLKSRFNKYIFFADYDGAQLFEIFKGRVERNDYRLDEAAAKQVQAYLQELYDLRDDNFGNARDVRNLFEKIVAKQANRVAAIENPSDEEILAIVPADLEGLLKHEEE